MSMHNTPLTPAEEAGLRAHGLKIGTPSQLSDAFRQGMAYALAAPTHQPCGMKHDSVWKEGAGGLPYQQSNFSCRACGYVGSHDTHPGCVMVRTAPAQQPTDWREAVLDALASTGGDMPVTATPAEIVRAVIDAHVQIALDPRVSDAAPAQQPYTDSTPGLSVGDSAFESWFSTYNPASKGDKQRYRDAYAAGMGDPMVTAAPAQQPEHPPLPVPRKPDENGAGWFTAGQMRAYVDADRAQRFIAPSVGHEEFARLYYRACDSSNPDDWMAAALAAQRVINAERPAAPKCLRTSVACSWPDCGANCRHAAPKEQA